MRTAATVSLYIGYALLLAAFVNSIFRALKRRDPHRLDLAFFITLLVFQLPLGPQRFQAVAIFQLGCLFVVPYALLRLVEHFRDVGSLLKGLSLVPAVAAIVAGGLLPRVFEGPVKTGADVTMTLLLASVATMMQAEVRSSTGIRARRIGFATIATSLLAVNSALNAPSELSHAIGLAVGPAARLLQGVAHVCYFFAFATPRPLLTRWRRAEQANYLGQVSEREPEERGRRAADDLFQAAARSVGGAVTFVALRPTSATDDFVVRISSERSLSETILRPGTGLLGQACDLGTGVSGPMAECEPALAARLRPHGVQALVAPIVASGQSWGVVVVTHRRGALFPEDDLAMLTQFGRSAATALDHARLITERRDIARQAADRRLREVESRVSLMLDSIKDYAMLLIDAEGRVAAWHLGAQHLFGHRPDQITDQDASSVYDMRPDQLNGWLVEARARGYAEREGTCRRRDGSTFVGATVIRPLVHEPGEPPGFVAVTRDMTEQRSLEERLRQGQKMEAIGQLAGGVAHDFNNLLTAILGYADWLEQGLTGDPRREQVVEIQKAAERAADLTRQLLAFSRQKMLQPSTVNLTQLVADLLPMLRRLIEEHIEIVDATSPTLFGVLGDRSQIEQIVMNLVVNARDAITAGGRITIRTEDIWLGESANTTGLPGGPHVLLEVTDNGTGMDSATKQRVFEPFFTTKDVGRGTGLGLSTVYGIVQQMHGAIEIQTELGRGSTFRLYFPQTSQMAVSDPPAFPASVAHGGETLLLVEDDDVVRAHLANVLEAHGFTVIAAEHPQSALALTRASRAPIDLVISDVMLPGSTGPELVHLLGPSRPGVSALFIGGGIDVAAVSRMPADGAELMRRPFSSTELLAKVRRILSAA